VKKVQNNEGLLPADVHDQGKVRIEISVLKNKIR